MNLTEKFTELKMPYHACRFTENKTWQQFYSTCERGDWFIHLIRKIDFPDSYAEVVYEATKTLIKTKMWRGTADEIIDDDFLIIVYETKYSEAFDEAIYFLSPKYGEKAAKEAADILAKSVAEKYREDFLKEGADIVRNLFPMEIWGL